MRVKRARRGRLLRRRRHSLWTGARSCTPGKTAAPRPDRAAAASSSPGGKSGQPATKIEETGRVPGPTAERAGQCRRKCTTPGGLPLFLLSGARRRVARHTRLRTSTVLFRVKWNARHAWEKRFLEFPGSSWKKRPLFPGSAQESREPLALLPCARRLTMLSFSA